MEKLRDFVLHPHIHSALERWLEGIRKVQARRKEEIVNATNRHRNVGNRHQEDKGTSGLHVLSRSVFIHLVAGDPMIVSPLDTIYIFDKDTWMRLPNKRAGILLVFLVYCVWIWQRGWQTLTLMYCLKVYCGTPLGSQFVSRESFCIYLLPHTCTRRYINLYHEGTFLMQVTFREVRDGGWTGRGFLKVFTKHFYKYVFTK